MNAVNLPKNQPDNKNRKHYLTSNRQPPTNRFFNITHPVVEPVRDDDPHSDE